jgi:hypothetical protein
MDDRNTQKFELGRVVGTNGALIELERAGEHFLKYISRHATGDWGEVPPEDHEENEFSLRNEFRIISVYTLGSGVKIWIITEADRSSTTILLPEEY